MVDEEFVHHCSDNNQNKNIKLTKTYNNENNLLKNKSGKTTGPLEKHLAGSEVIDVSERRDYSHSSSKLILLTH